MVLGENSAVVTVEFNITLLSPGNSRPQPGSPGLLVKVWDAKIKTVRVAK